MSATYILPNQCPFQIGDRVRCIHTRNDRPVLEGTVIKLDEQNVFCETDDTPTTPGRVFYRTWTYELMGETGGDLTRIARFEI